MSYDEKLKDAYRLLGLDEGATIEEVKKTYRKIAKTTHPDIDKDGEEKFKKIREAYEMIREDLDKKTTTKIVRHKGDNLELRTIELIENKNEQIHNVNRHYSILTKSSILSCATIIIVLSFVKDILSFNEINFAVILAILVGLAITLLSINEQRGGKIREIESDFNDDLRREIRKTSKSGDNDTQGNP